MAKRQFSLLGIAASVCLAVRCAAALAGSTPITTVEVASGLSRPIFVTHAPGDFDRLFIVEQGGRIKILEAGSVSATPFLDIGAIVNSSGNEQGLLGLAFHPDFADNGFFYVNYTRVPDGATVVSRFEVPVGTPDEADDTSELPLLSIAQPQPNHNAGWLSFGPDGYLYIATGDGGGGGDDDTGHTAGLGNGQDITTLLGKMLRIDVDGNDGPGGNYGIPPDNPFVGVTGEDEIWSYGLRNPWRNAFDGATGDFYVADVGQSTWEEVNFQPAAGAGGENWGWRCREGAHDFNFGGTAGCATATLLDPIHEYSHAGGACSITGGEVYRGCAIPDLQGTYFFADYCSAKYSSFRVIGGVVMELTDRTAELALPTGNPFPDDQPTSFGRDAAGEVYICLQGGTIHKIVPDGVPDQCNAVPTVSGWGMLSAIVLLLSAGTVVLRRRPTSRAIPT